MRVPVYQVHHNFSDRGPITGGSTCDRLYNNNTAGELGEQEGVALVLGTEMTGGGTSGQENR